MKQVVRRTLLAMLHGAKRIEVQVGAREPMTPDWLRVLNRVQIARTELETALLFVRESK